jgi:hypothetical protein
MNNDPTTTENFEFQKFDKIPRFRRDIIITEKIDGTNACILVVEKSLIEDWQISLWPFINTDGDCMLLAGSRKRWLDHTKQGDNYGFRKWVGANRDELATLGPGRHYGEWWGLGIQRRYNMDHKVFSLFNTARWGSHNLRPSCTSVVPVICSGAMSGDTIELALDELRLHGSLAAPTFMKPEGIVIYMTQARRLFKITLENDGIPKTKIKEVKTTVYKTAAQWLCEFEDLTIVDADGWDRSNYEKSFNEELITRGEFRYRANRSTVRGTLG